MLLYFTTLAMPEIAQNDVILFVGKLIDDIYNMKVIGGLVAIGAFFYLVSMIVKGIQTSEYVFSLLSRKNRNSKKGGSSGSDGEFTEYVEVIEEDV
jgi:hypothetical protein